MDAAAVSVKYGVLPSQIIDLKGLMGDSSDNIPGVPGVGEKTAVKLLAQFGSIENLLANLEQVAGKKLQENLRNHVDEAIISKKLATIDCHMPLAIPEEFVMQPDILKIRELFTELEFKSLLTKVDNLFPGAAPVTPTAENLPQAVVITSREDIHDWLKGIRESDLLFFQVAVTKTVSKMELKGIGVASIGGALYIPAGVEAWEVLVHFLADSNVKKVTHDAKMVYNMFQAMGKKMCGLGFDTMLASYLLDPTATQYRLPTLMEKYLGICINWQCDINHPDYAVWAAQSIRDIYPELSKRLAEAELDRLYYEVELPLIEVLAATESTGVKVDNGYLQNMSADIAVKINLLLQEIYKLAGEEFNVNSTKQLGIILFEKLNLKAVKKTKTGYSTDAEVLEKLAGEHPVIDKLLEYRLLTKLKSTYLDGLKGLMDNTTGRIHTSFNQTVTATGRLSSSEPNLQNIPVRTEVGRKIRELFVPGEGWQYIMSADYSQIELRILAHISGDYNLMEAFRQNQDIHTRTASEVFGVAMDEVTGEMRSRAKAVNFGIVYGISDYGLSRDIGVSRAEAGQYIDSYFVKYRGVKDYIESIVASAHRQGYVATIYGRRRYLPDINSNNFNQRSFAERTAMNTPIQGAAADIIKKAMVDVYNVLQQRKFRSRILLQVHDELVMEVTEKEKDFVGQIVKETMEQAVHLDVPLVVDIKFGRNWAEAK